MDVISAEVILRDLSGWQAADEGRAITKRYHFESFAKAWGFMSACALKAEALDHHPDWRNVYSRVDVTLTTHDAGGLTRKDLVLAQTMDALFAL